MPRILIVDDEKFVLNTLRRMLSMRMRGVEVLTTDQPETVESLIQDRPVELLMTDLNMPGITGAEVIQKVKSVSPETVGILLSGENHPIPWRTTNGVFAFLGKPMSLVELEATTRKAMLLAQYQRAPENQKWLHQLERTVPPNHGEFPYDGRGCGKRWSEIYALTVGLNGTGINASASVIRLMNSDVMPPLAIMTGFVERLVRVADATQIEKQWWETLLQSEEARRIASSSGASESQQLLGQIQHILAGVASMVAELFRADPSQVVPVLGARWGFTRDLLRMDLETVAYPVH